MSEWLKNVGDEVSVGDGIAEIATDKASMTFESTEDFFVAKLLVPNGAEVAVGSPIMVTVEDAADVAAFANFEAPAPAAVVQSPPTPAPAAVAPAPVVVTPVATPPPTPTPAPVVTAPAPAAVKPAPVAPVQSSSKYTFRWGEGAKSGPLASQLSKQQNAYHAKYGRTGHKAL